MYPFPIRSSACVVCSFNPSLHLWSSPQHWDDKKKSMHTALPTKKCISFLSCIVPFSFLSLRVSSFWPPHSYFHYTWAFESEKCNGLNFGPRWREGSKKKKKKLERIFFWKREENGLSNWARCVFKLLLHHHHLLYLLSFTFSSNSPMKIELIFFFEALSLRFSLFWRLKAWQSRCFARCNFRNVFFFSWRAIANCKSFSSRGNLFGHRKKSLNLRDNASFSW